MSDFNFDPVADVVRFNERFNADNLGGPWTVEGREFIVNEIYRPLHSYNRIPAGGAPADALCPKCRMNVGTWVYDPFLAALHKPGQCEGLVAVPIINTGADLPRQSGKTTTALSVPFFRLFSEMHEQMSFVAAAEDQAIELVIQKLSKRIDEHPKLASRVHVTANKIINQRRHCELEVLPASHGAVTGRSTTLGEYDECRDQKSRVVTASMPAIMAQHGYKCPGGVGPDGKRYLSHGKWRAVGPNEEPEVECCPVLLGKSTSNKRKCGQRLRRHHARMLFLSASGVIEDNPSKDWFRNWIDTRSEKPDPYTHVWRTDKKINPSVSSEIHQAIAGSFGDVEGMKDEIAVELYNAPARIGEVFVTALEVDGASSSATHPLVGSPSPAVGFIDSSRTGDKTSLVVCVEVPKPGAAPLEVMDLAHVTVWNPRDRSSCPSGIIDEDLVGTALAEIMPRFPGLLRLVVDTRLMSWAKRLVRHAKTQPWGKRIGDTEGWTNTVNSAMYLDLHQRIRGQTIRLWQCLTPIGGSKRCEKCSACELRRELLSMRKRDLPAGGIEVYDAGGGKDGRNRKKGGVHRDVAMSLAGCCKLAADIRLEMTRGSQSKVLAANDSKKLAHIRPVMGGGGKKRAW